MSSSAGGAELVDDNMDVVLPPLVALLVDGELVELVREFSGDASLDCCWLDAIVVATVELELGAIWGSFRKLVKFNCM